LLDRCSVTSASATALFDLVVFEVGSCFTPRDPHSGMRGGHHHAKLFISQGEVPLAFGLDWPQTSVLPVAAFHIARITDVSHQARLILYFGCDCHSGFSKVATTSPSVGGWVPHVLCRDIEMGMSHKPKALGDGLACDSKRGSSCPSGWTGHHGPRGWSMNTGRACMATWGPSLLPSLCPNLW
jgi:hypothetical protein